MSKWLDSVGLSLCRETDPLSQACRRLTIFLSSWSSSCRVATLGVRQFQLIIIEKLYLNGFAGLILEIGDAANLLKRKHSDVDDEDE